ncbi:hypothetical protein M8C21_001470 [Ambrosia artemisiifolia]|uniref:Uncharacterized protein n=1 Tax=Ambrosia artemisiifolia TaxID=4212 RepID=A0AAD5DDQ0_AMBAR|nr:hypothetical protein M8C21_001470 [Ambrosia artemisiifolia]
MVQTQSKAIHISLSEFSISHTCTHTHTVTGQQTDILWSLGRELPRGGVASGCYGYRHVTVSCRLFMPVHMLSPSTILRLWHLAEAASVVAEATATVSVTQPTTKLTNNSAARSVVFVQERKWTRTRDQDQIEYRKSPLYN